MSFNVNFDQSNAADWAFDITATDADTGDAIDFTGATVTLKVKDENNCLKLTATVGDGITLPDANTLSFLFDDTDMATLCVGTYNIGCIYVLNSETNQIFVGTLSVYDGVMS